MYLKNLSLINFKNFESFDFQACAKINCLIGDNGIGKTNLLDSIHYLSFCKSFLNLSDRQNIKTGEDFFVIKGEFMLNDNVENIYCGVQKDKRKSFRRNAVEYQKLSEHIGLLPVVYSTPYDSDLIHLGSDIRRKFADAIISQFDKSYLHNLINYNKALEQRNILLKNKFSSKRIDPEEIEIWDFKLSENAEKIYELRKNFAEELIPIFQKYYRLISDNKEKVELIYSSQLHKNNLYDSLRKNLERDLFLGYTSYGTHRDDFDFLIENQAIKKYGSQGQQKTFVISLKFAWFEYIKSKLNMPAILLLDDIFDKLDKKRVKVITQLVAENGFGQIFITDTSYSRMPDILKDLNINYKILNLSTNEIITN
ncbi:MAG: DNA replication and repair protein RecF [Bacteroidales bacterium]|nr:DNA replication and repair protein RecF [Bacteroidales bacterium]MCK9499594.1 DNA replication and repair protein RecF [Bacteroidales bacterium]MDY0314912.1 DNA replication and repair protein RecF [Bacteroidales bacterium]